MITWKQPLQDFEWLIHQVWYLELEADDVITQQPRLIPNPRAHLLFTPDEQKYSYDSGITKFEGKGSHLLSVSDQLLSLDDSAPLKRIGVTFRPEGLYLLNSSVGHHLNQCSWPTWLDTFFGPALHNQLWQSNDKSHLLDVFHHHFHQLNLNRKKDRAFSITHQATKIVENRLSDWSIEQIADQCACSRRTLERHFKQVTGLSVKQYLMIMKLEEIVLSIYKQDADPDWAEFAQAFGFSDQSHLIRQLKDQLNRTPAKYLKDRDLTIDIYGDFE
ncbi:helix-turn-helix transcriptional regulator [Vibrio coralliilyticus]|uniref:helix-turn-helix transcriptional regulator n=1 Tax=Vibrio coralliilyticus TaxID=190893 RepID=UPI0015619626|nr:AraC family transcriptional regulator [Vibrio coralliilyticus]NRF61159.1 helix-turn-helix transcriptional regulator [Vibrio coralliilyticus]